MVLKKLKENPNERKSRGFSNNFSKREESHQENETSEYINTSSVHTGTLFQGNEKPKQEGFNAVNYYPWNENFLWNYSLIKEFFSIVDDKKWILPVIHGYIN